jgi:hypothetical protein
LAKKLAIRETGVRSIVHDKFFSLLKAPTLTEYNKELKDLNEMVKEEGLNYNVL